MTSGTAVSAIVPFSRTMPATLFIPNFFVCSWIDYFFAETQSLFLCAEIHEFAEIGERCNVVPAGDKVAQLQ